MVIVINCTTIFPRDFFILEKDYPGLDLYESLINQTVRAKFPESEVFLFSNNKKIHQRCAAFTGIHNDFFTTGDEDDSFLPQSIRQILLERGFGDQAALVLCPQLGVVTTEKIDICLEKYHDNEGENVAICSTTEVDSLTHPSWCYRVEPNISGVRYFPENERLVDEKHEPQTFIQDTFKSTVPLRKDVAGSQFMPALYRLEQSVNILALHENMPNKIIPARPTKEHTSLFVYSLPVFKMDRESVMDY
ncbi:MAG: hypothetical protein ACNI27_17200 [Desulfovibrio sp.]